jgi:zinc protease
VPAYDPEAPGESAALDMLAAVLGNGIASRLSQSLQVEQGIAIDTGAWYTPQSRDATTFSVYGVPAQGHTLDEVEAAIDSELAKIAATGPTEEELARAKRVAKASLTFIQDSQSALARQYGAALAMGFDVEDVQRWPEFIDAVTVEDVRRAAATYLKPETSVTGRLLRKEAPGGEKS